MDGNTARVEEVPTSRAPRGMLISTSFRMNLVFPADKLPTSTYMDVLQGYLQW